MPLDERQPDGRYRYRLCYFELPRGHQVGVLDDLVFQNHALVRLRP